MYNKVNRKSQKLSPLSKMAEKLPSESIHRKMRLFVEHVKKKKKKKKDLETVKEKAASILPH